MREFFLSDQIISAGGLEAAHEHMDGEDPFFFWGRQAGMYAYEVEKALKLPRNASNGCPCDLGILEDFCVEIGVHPADLFQPSEIPLPTVVVETILSVAQDNEYSREDRMRAKDALFVEREKFTRWCNSELNSSPIHVINSASQMDLNTIAESISPISENETMYLSSAHALVAGKKFDDFEEMLHDDVRTFRQQVEATKKQKERFLRLTKDSGLAIYRDDYNARISSEASKMLDSLILKHGEDAWRILTKEIVEPDGDFYPQGHMPYMRSRSCRNIETGEVYGWPTLANVFAHSYMKFKQLAKLQKEQQAAYDDASKKLFEYQDWHAACVHDGYERAFANYIVSGLLSLDLLKDDESSDSKPESGLT